MKKERLKILDKLSRCEITPEEADKELWGLFSVSCKIPKPHGKRVDYANYYIKKYSSQFGLDKSKLEQFMLNFLGDEWMSDSNKSYS